MTTADEFLAHYGVKGMKWGKRRSRNDSTSTQKTKAPVSKSKRALQIAGTAYAAKFAYNIAKEVLPYAAVVYSNKKAVANGAKFAAQMMADSGLTNYKTVIL